MPITCSGCGASMPDISAFCPSCGTSVTPGEPRLGDRIRQLRPQLPDEPNPVDEPNLVDEPEPVETSHLPVPSLRTRIIAALSYVMFVPALVFLLIKPFRDEAFVRFNAFQSLLFTAAVVVIAIVLRVVSFGLLSVREFGLLFMVVLVTVIAIAIVVLWLVLVIKALQGEKFRLPRLGRWADR